MAVSRADVVDQNFLDGIRSASCAEIRHQGDILYGESSYLIGREAIAIFCSMVESRHLDLRSRELKKDSQSFYTIGSSGHEGSAAVAAALRPTDPAFLHYRSGGFFIQRARQVPGQTPLLDVLLGEDAK